MSLRELTREELISAGRDLANTGADEIISSVVDHCVFVVGTKMLNREVNDKAHSRALVKKILAMRDDDGESLFTYQDRVRIYRLVDGDLAKIDYVLGSIDNDKKDGIPNFKGIFGAD